MAGRAGSGVFGCSGLGGAPDTTDILGRVLYDDVDVETGATEGPLARAADLGDRAGGRFTAGSATLFRFNDGADVVDFKIIDILRPRPAGGAAAVGGVCRGKLKHFVRPT